MNVNLFMKLFNDLFGLFIDFLVNAFLPGITPFQPRFGVNVTFNYINNCANYIILVNILTNDVNDCPRLC